MLSPYVDMLYVKIKIKIGEANGFVLIGIYSCLNIVQCLPHSTHRASDRLWTPKFVFKTGQYF